MKSAQTDRQPRIRRSVWLSVGLVWTGCISLLLSIVTIAGSDTIELIVAQCCAILYFAFTLMLLRDATSGLKWLAVPPGILIGFFFLGNFVRLIN